ncbi:MAG: carboxypeptidase-like regulatory domain-containing protein, partial [Bacteroidales bacterium]|nr:carboxypeptidase-like regulatory domain-containing protein [Bacteroidales bacterium]
MRKITFLLVFFLLAGVNFAFAQTRTITGKVTSSQDGMGIPGATVLIKGTTIGTTTSIEGNYEIEVQPNHRTLVFRYVGMSTQEI